MKKRYSYRAYPTRSQQQSLARLFGCVRVVFNDLIEARERDYQAAKKPMSSLELQRLVTTQAKLTPEREWLTQVSSTPLEQSARDANQAYQNFFDSVSGKRKGPKVGKPRFKSRRDHRQAARFTRSAKFKVRQASRSKAQVYLPKIGWITFHYSRPLPSDPSSVTIIHGADDTYHVSFVVEAPAKPLPTSSTAAGVDLGLADVAAIIRTDGARQKVTNPKVTKRYERKLARAQKALARKQKGSNNWHKQRIKVARIHSRIRNTRADHTHKLARRLIDENQIIAVEDLNVAGLARSGAKGKRGRGMRKSVHDAGWATLIRLLQEKGAEAGRQIALVNPAYTSQTCAVCGVLDGPKPLDVRQWTCTGCDTHLDRDYNAAVNILTGAGHALSACGVDVRRPLASAETAQPTNEAGTHRTDLGPTCAQAA